ncbi:predicted protein [Nematostella vectensis]|uniref:tRNA N(3)-methylcytidine methyltransferase n=1 Tax=Nematostella vectensis TaxID=45351 RepID=A7RRX4_NEMVE|nr:tRNA N(3)-methylcytidine methyltransferase METTL6 [Nematostella vectensis]EDO45902.1 predicted protein [Nematostella vectensis]|eukprot:XP_001637965.1 predicted protein [Nematostella vectensis]
MAEGKDIRDIQNETESSIQGLYPRVLTDEEKQKLERDTSCISEFKRNKLEQDARKNWDLFYKRNSTNFFKDRRWTTREFTELLNVEDEKLNEKVLLEAGCGVGNLINPLLEEGYNFYFHACDFSPRAVNFVKESPFYDEAKVNAFQCDLTKDDLLENIPACSVDIATLIFVLSAIHPDKMITALLNIFKVLKPGGLLLLRDYGLYDHAMLRFAPGHKLSEQFYVRQDGTRAFYFSQDDLEVLFKKAGFVVLMNKYVEKRTVNKKENIDVPRIFVQGKFMKPES